MEVNRNQLRDLTDWRRAVSGEAAALAAARASPSQVRLVRRLAAIVELAVADFPAFRLADARFHLAIAEASASARLVAAETQVQTELGDILRLTQGPALARKTSQAGHQPLVAAIAAGDSVAARDAMQTHAEATHDWVVGLRGACGVGAADPAPPTTGALTHSRLRLPGRPTVPGVRGRVRAGRGRRRGRAFAGRCSPRGSRSTSSGSGCRAGR